MRVSLVTALFGTALLFGCQAGHAAAISPIITNPANGHRYALLSTDSWTGAEIDAISMGGHLATINDAAENAFLLSTFGNFGNQQRLLWIGLTDVHTEGTFRWTSRQPVSYTNWGVGEPNGGTGENYAAIFYPNHSARGRWNDWGSRTTDPIGLPFNGVVELEPPNPKVFSFNLDSDTLVIAPVGNLERQPLTSVGLAWEAAHEGWNSDLSFNTTGWSPATPSGSRVWGPNADTPLYGRRVFTLESVPESAVMLGSIDDDVLVYINGQLVYSDTNGSATDFGPLDVSNYLLAGQNILAFKAHDSFGVGQSLRITLAGVIPEPAGVVAVLILFPALLRRQQRHYSKLNDR
ncbi:MAG: hypothetical protein IAG10_03065 [Planctomycetaceae bacterium]|nr:hypothetical protein [Planctomycetaceae bacterium]